MTVRAALRRLLLAVPAFIGATLVTFALIHLAPGDPAALRAGIGRGVTVEVVAADRALAGLDRPLGERYLAWLSRSARLDFGRSLLDGRPVRERVGEALPTTLALGALAALLAVLLAVPLGAWSALRQGTRRAALLDGALLLGYGVPGLVLALWLLHAGAPWGRADLVGLLAPAACLALPTLLLLWRHVRAALLTVLAADYLRTARAKGAGPARVLLVHALPNALLAPLALLGGQVPALLSGSVLVECVFGVRGLGTLGYEAVLARDYPTLLALTTLATLLALGGVLLADLTSAWVDPRLRGERRGGSSR